MIRKYLSFRRQTDNSYEDVLLENPVQNYMKSELNESSHLQ